MSKKSEMIKKGTRVKTSRIGRTAKWYNTHSGTVTQKIGKSVFVKWDGINMFEDEMDVSEVIPIKRVAK